MKTLNAIVLTHGLLDTMNAKTCHGLLRGTYRYQIQAVIDYKSAGKDAGEVLNGTPLNIPVYASVSDFHFYHPTKAEVCIIGVALEGGLLPDSFRSELYQAMTYGMSLVNGLHTYLSDDPIFSDLAKKHQVTLTDIRKPKAIKDLKFWTGRIKKIKVPRLAVLGMDCAVGKRTTSRWLMEICQEAGLKAEMIYTGQTGWLQGHRYGFIFDSTLNDFVSGELEDAVVRCAEEAKPDIIFIEGQSSLRNPSGPCGSELLVSAVAKHVILQHQPARKYFDDSEEMGYLIPTLQSEIELIHLYGAEVVAITINAYGWNEQRVKDYLTIMQPSVSCPMLMADKNNLATLVPAFRLMIANQNMA